MISEGQIWRPYGNHRLCLSPSRIVGCSTRYCGDGSDGATDIGPEVGSAGVLPRIFVDSNVVQTVGIPQRHCRSRGNSVGGFGSNSTTDETNISRWAGSPPISHAFIFSGSFSYYCISSHPFVVSMRICGS